MFTQLKSVGRDRNLWNPVEEGHSSRGIWGNGVAKFLFRREKEQRER